MRRVVILLGAVIFGAALFIFDRTAPATFLQMFNSWPDNPWREAMADRTWIMLLIAAALFVVSAVLIIRGAFAPVWFLALATSSLPLLASVLPCAYHFRSAVQGSLQTDVGGNLLYKYATSKARFFAATRSERVACRHGGLWFLLPSRRRH
jgi:hypothetical protein